MDKFCFSLRCLNKGDKKNVSIFNDCVYYNNICVGCSEIFDTIRNCSYCGGEVNFMNWTFDEIDPFCSKECCQKSPISNRPQKDGSVDYDTNVEKKITVKNSDDIGHVYAMGNSNGLVKIGVAKNPIKRLKALQCSSPVLICLLFSRVVNNPFAVEGKLHRIFKKKRSHGEWFFLDNYDLVSLLLLLDNICVDPEFTIEKYERLSFYKNKNGNGRNLFLPELYSQHPLPLSQK